MTHNNKEWIRLEVESIIQSDELFLDYSHVSLNVTDEDVRTFVQIIKTHDQKYKIQGFSLPERRLSDAAVRDLCTLPWLKKLDLRDTEITDDSIILIAEKLKELEILNISENKKITNLAPLRSLERLRMLFASSISLSTPKADILSLARNANLIVLDLDYSTNDRDLLEEIDQITRAKERNQAVITPAEQIQGPSQGRTEVTTHRTPERRDEDPRGRPAVDRVRELHRKTDEETKQEESGQIRENLRKDDIVTEIQEEVGQQGMPEGNADKSRGLLTVKTVHEPQKTDEGNKDRQQKDSSLPQDSHYLANSFQTKPRGQRSFGDSQYRERQHCMNLCNLL